VLKWPLLRRVAYGFQVSRKLHVLMQVKMLLFKMFTSTFSVKLANSPSLFEQQT